MKFLNEFDQKYGKYGFNVISVNMDSPRSLSKVKSYIKSKNFTFTVLSDPNSGLFRKSLGSIMPYVLLVNQDGVIKHKHTGYNLGDEVNLEYEIVELLAIDSLKIDLPQKKLKQLSPIKSLKLVYILLFNFIFTNNVSISYVSKYGDGQKVYEKDESKGPSKYNYLENSIQFNNSYILLKRISSLNFEKSYKLPIRRDKKN